MMEKYLYQGAAAKREYAGGKVMLGKIENGPPQEQRSMQEMAVYRLLEQLAIPVFAARIMPRS